MSELITGDEAYYDRLNSVVELFVQDVPINRIASQLGMKRKDVLDCVDEFKNSAVNTDVWKGRAEELTAKADQHFGQLIQKAYEVIDSLDHTLELSHQSQTTKLKAISTIAELEAKRIDLLQKTGLLDASDLGDQLAEMEEFVSVIMDIFNNDLCKHCTTVVNRRIDEHTGRQTVVLVNERI